MTGATWVVSEREMGLSPLVRMGLTAGSKDRYHDGSGTWGVGLILDHPRGMPLAMAVDYGEISPDDVVFNEADIAMWSGRVRVGF